MRTKKISFVLDIDAAGYAILQNMAKRTIRQRAAAIMVRAASIASSITSDEIPTFTITDEVGVIKRGKRAITTVSATYLDKREEYIARTSLAKAKDAGRTK